MDSGFGLRSLQRQSQPLIDPNEGSIQRDAARITQAPLFKYLLRRRVSPGANQSVEIELRK
jgi:hypothetical protein